MMSAAASRTAGPSPSAPPMANASSRTPSSRRAAIRAAKSREAKLLPRSSQAISRASAALARIASASAGLPGFRPATSTISTGARPSARPAALARSAQARASAASGADPSLPTQINEMRIRSWPRAQTRKRLALLPVVAPLVRRRAARRLDRPDLLDVVEGAHFRAEQVDDHVPRVDQHPVAVGQTLHAGAAIAGLLQGAQQVVGHGADMPVRP